MRAGGAEGDPERDGRRALVNGWESRPWRLEDKHLREGSSVRQFGRPRPLRIRHRRRRVMCRPLILLRVSLTARCATTCALNNSAQAHLSEFS